MSGFLGPGPVDRLAPRPRRDRSETRASQGTRETEASRGPCATRRASQRRQSRSVRPRSAATTVSANAAFGTRAKTPRSWPRDNGMKNTKPTGLPPQTDREPRLFRRWSPPDRDQHVFRCRRSAPCPTPWSDWADLSTSHRHGRRHPGGCRRLRRVGLRAQGRNHPPASEPPTPRRATPPITLPRESLPRSAESWPAQPDKTSLRAPSLTLSPHRLSAVQRELAIGYRGYGSRLRGRSAHPSDFKSYRC